MKDYKIVVRQRCNCCGKEFRIRYEKAGCLSGYTYLDAPCKCESDFSPVDGRSISEWIAEIEG